MYYNVRVYYVNTHIYICITKTQVAGARRQDIINIDICGVYNINVHMIM